MEIELRMPKKFKQFGYNPNDPEIIRRKKLVLATKQDKSFVNDFKKFRNLQRQQAWNKLRVDNQVRTYKKVNRDWLWYNIWYKK